MFRNKLLENGILCREMITRGGSTLLFVVYLLGLAYKSILKNFPYFLQYRRAYFGDALYFKFQVFFNLLVNCANTS